MRDSNIHIVHDLDKLLDKAALCLHLPYASLSAAQQRVLEAARRTDSYLKNKKVLIVDDDMRNIFALTTVLERYGMKVLFAENGKMGIDLLLQNPDTQIMLTDIMMPEMDGYEIIQHIRKLKQHQHLPIIALTAKAMKNDRERCLKAGATEYLTKPVDIDQLLSVLRMGLIA